MRTVEVSIDAPVVVGMAGMSSRLSGRSETISLTHVVLLLECPLAPGEVLDLRLGDERLSAEVDECTSQDGRYEIICRIVEWDSMGHLHSILLDLMPLAV